jgi:hypothetical protein
MAHVFLFFESGPGSSAVLSAGGGDTPGLIYLEKNLEAIEDANKSGGSQYCKSNLLSAFKAALATLVAILDTDEEGNFDIGKIRPGLYKIGVLIRLTQSDRF